MSKKPKPTAKRAKLPPVGTQWRSRGGHDNQSCWWEMTRKGLRFMDEGVDAGKSEPTLEELDKPNGYFTRFRSTYRKPEPKPKPESQIDRVLRMMIDLTATVVQLTRRIESLEKRGKR